MLIDIHEQSRGRWRGILATMGMSQLELSGKHTACPICQGGVDRFRFDNKDGNGTWICSHCGAGRGVDMVMALKGVQFKDAVEEVRKLVGVAKAEPIKAGQTDDQKRQFRRDLWRSSVPVSKGDPVDTYLAGRGFDMPRYSKSMRFCPDCRYNDKQRFPAMIAVVQDAGGIGVSLHRTFLLDGEKAPVDSPRMVTAGELPMGSAIRLSEPCRVLGIAEGIETAYAAWEMFGIPTWAAINAHLLANWEPPTGTEEVVIYGDNDESFTGHAASYALAKRMRQAGLVVTVRLPNRVGDDWADVHANHYEK